MPADLTKDAEGCEERPRRKTWLSLIKFIGETFAMVPLASADDGDDLFQIITLFVYQEGLYFLMFKDEKTKNTIK